MAAARVERGDLWKSNALSVQRWLREQFRVEVDRRFRHHPIFSDGYFASTVQRWLQRFRDFKRDSLPSSIANEWARKSTLKKSRPLFAWCKLLLCRSLAMFAMCS